MKLLKSISLYSGINIVNAMIPFLLLPVLTEYLSAEDFGKLAVYETFIAFTLPLVMLGVSGAVNIEFFKLDTSSFKSYLRSVILIPLAAFVIIEAVYIILGKLVANYYGLSVEWLIMIPVISLFQSIIQIQNMLFQSREQPLNYGKIQIGYIFSNIILSLILIIAFKMNLAGRLFAIFISSGFFAIISGFLIIRSCAAKGFRVDSAHIKDALKVGLPLVPHNIGSTIIVFSDRLFIASMVGMNAVGIYSVGYQVGMVMSVVQNSVNLAWVPYLFKQLTEVDDDKKTKIVKASYIIAGLLFFILLCLYLSKGIIFKYFIDAKYEEAMDFVLWVGLGYVFLGMYKLVVNYIFFVKKTYILTILTIVNIVSNVVLNYFLIRHYGSLGAAYATLISMIIVFVLSFIISYRLYPMPWLKVFK